MLHHCQFTMYLGAPVKQIILRLFLLLSGMREAFAAFPPHKLQTQAYFTGQKISP